MRKMETELEGYSLLFYLSREKVWTQEAKVIQHVKSTDSEHADTYK
jgi:hypothetical protein